MPLGVWSPRCFAAAGLRCSEKSEGDRSGKNGEDADRNRDQNVDDDLRFRLRRKERTRSAVGGRSEIFVLDGAGAVGEFNTLPGRALRCGSACRGVRRNCMIDVKEIATKKPEATRGGTGNLSSTTGVHIRSSRSIEIAGLIEPAMTQLSLLLHVCMLVECNNISSVLASEKASLYCTSANRTSFLEELFCRLAS